MGWSEFVLGILSGGFVTALYTTSNERVEKRRDLMREAAVAFMTAASEAERARWNAREADARYNSVYTETRRILERASEGWTEGDSGSNADQFHTLQNAM